MHAVALVLSMSALVFVVLIYLVLLRMARNAVVAFKMISEGMVDIATIIANEVATNRVAIDALAPHVIGIRATLESVVRLEPRSPVPIEPQLQNLTESITILRDAIETLHADPQDISAQVNGIAESVDLLRSTVQARPMDPPRMTALEAPQVPTPHGAPKTLLLMNDDRTVAHRVTYHRDVPVTYAYGGRVFERHNQDADGAWEFLPC